MNRKLLPILGTFFTLFALGSILLVACSVQGAPTTNAGGAPSTGNTGGNPNCASGTVHTLATTFQESCVHVAKGASLQVVPSVPSFHNLVTGSWVNGNQVLMKEPGAPAINNVQVTSSTISIGPFTTAGTYQIECTVHPNMNLTIIVN